MQILIKSMSFRILIYNFFMFNEKLKELRTENNLTQIQLAKIIGCNQSMIARWEKAECEPTENVIRKVALFFKVSADYLLGLEDESGRKIYHIQNNVTNNYGSINIK